MRGNTDSVQLCALVLGMLNLQVIPQDNRKHMRSGILTDFLVRDLTWTRDFLFYGARMLIIFITKCISGPLLNQFYPLRTFILYSLRCVLILSSHRRQIFPTSFMSWGLTTKMKV